MKNEKSYYAVIPAPVRYCQNLSPNAKLLYGEITALCNKEGYCWASNNYFAKLYGVHTITISRWIKNLEDNHFIICKMKNKNKRRIYIHEPLAKMLRGFSKNAKGVKQKCLGYNNNITNKTNISVKMIDKRFAMKLFKLVRAKRKININHQKWSCHFAKLRVKSGIKKQRIAKVLNWYENHIGERFVPVSYSAGSFCSKFLRIEDAMNRYIENIESGEAPLVYKKRIVKHTIVD